MRAEILALRQTSPELATICLSNGEELAATVNLVADLRLTAGLGFEEEELERLRAQASLALAKRRALGLLSLRQMSAKELRDKLVQKGETPENAEKSVAWLEENRLLDDESYAAAVVRHYAAKGYGAGRVRQELQRRGISRELRDEAMEAMPDNGEKLMKLLSARLRDPDDGEAVRKASAALFRRGYSWEEIRAALEDYHAHIEEGS